MLFILCSVDCFGQDSFYSWPLKIPIESTSRFGDYRGGHWHAGIDLRTQGRTGLRVYAIADGYIFKVRTSFWGYGKALYLRLNDGGMAVYGHLDRFMPELNERLKKAQMSSRNYFQEIVFSPSEFPVKRGAHIAYSGRSGVGYPHLHLETRDPDNYPINPLHYLPSLGDRRPPIIKRLAVKRYLTEYGAYNYHDREIIEISSAADAAAIDTVIAYGQTVLSVGAYDPGDGFNYGINWARLVLDGRIIFSFKRDTLDYTTGRQIKYVNDQEMTSLLSKTDKQSPDQDKNAFYRLYVQPEDKQRFYGSYRYPAGIIDTKKLDGAVHECRIVVGDFSGNADSLVFHLKKAELEPPLLRRLVKSDATITLVMDRLPPQYEVELQYCTDSAGLYIDIDSKFDGSTNQLRFSGRARSAIYRMRIADAEGKSSRWIHFTADPKSDDFFCFGDYLAITVDRAQELYLNGNRIEDGNFNLSDIDGKFVQGLIPLPARTDKIEITDGNGRSVYKVHLIGGDKIVHSADSLIRLSIAERNLYGRSPIRITDLTRKNDRYLFKIEPVDLLFRENAAVSVKLPDSTPRTDKMGIYWINPTDEKPVFMTRFDSPTKEFFVGSGGDFAIIEDRQPPSITNISPAPGSAVRTRTPRIECRISDDLSGFSREWQLEIKIDDLWVPADYDITTETYTYQIANPLRQGEHFVSIKATDNQGNTKTATVKFAIFGKY